MTVEGSPLITEGTSHLKKHVQVLIIHAHPGVILMKHEMRASESLFYQKVKAST